jgi:hypothetical protein
MSEYQRKTAPKSSTWTPAALMGGLRRRYAAAIVATQAAARAVPSHHGNGRKCRKRAPSRSIIRSGVRAGATPRS